MAVSACRVVVARIWTMTMWVLSYFRFDPDNNNFPLHLCMSLSYRLHKVVDSTEFCACLNGASVNIVSQIIMTFTIIMNHEELFRLITEITIVWSNILFTILIINIKPEHIRIMISVTVLYWSTLLWRKNEVIIMLKVEFHIKEVVR